MPLRSLCCAKAGFAVPPRACAAGRRLEKLPRRQECGRELAKAEFQCRCRRLDARIASIRRIHATAVV